jgi:Leucine-rich repeat (LRR) protein
MENKHFLSSNNQISEQCTIIVEYTSLQQDKQVCLTHTLSIKTLPPPSFSSNYTMKIVQINFCQLLTLSQLPFTLPSSLEKLDLSYNLLSIFILSFPLPSYLKYLYLDYNPNLIDINFGQKRVQQKLIGLSLRHNKHVQLSSLPLYLTELDLTNCNLLQSPMLTLLRSLTKLTHLSLGENQLKQLPILNERIQLKYLNLSNNHLTFIEDRWLYRQIQILDLRFNQIKSLEFFKERLKINKTFRQNNNDQVSMTFKCNQKKKTQLDLSLSDEIRYENKITIFNLLCL